MSDKTLEKIRDSIEEAIKPILKKGEAMSPADLESLTKAVCVIEKIKRIEDGNSYDDGSYSEHNSYGNDGYSYERGRSPITGRYVSRDAMPYHDGGASGRYYGDEHYSNHYNAGNSNRSYNEGASTRRYYDGSARNDYSGHSIQDRMVDRLERMIDEAQTEHERQTVKDWIRRLKE